MEMLWVLKKPKSFWPGKRVIVLNDIQNRFGETIKQGEIVEITARSYQRTLDFDIKNKGGIEIYKVFCESLELIK